MTGEHQKPSWIRPGLVLLVDGNAAKQNQSGDFVDASTENGAPLGDGLTVS
jgi:hypothetical protein